MFLVLWLSSAIFSAAHTSAIIIPLLHWLVPSVTLEQLRWMHFGIRKLAHFSVYAVLALLWYRAFFVGQRLPALQAAFAALAIAVFCGAADETHQAFVPSRRSSIVDLGIDSTGAAIAMVMMLAGRGVRLFVQLSRRERLAPLRQRRAQHAVDAPRPATPRSWPDGGPGRRFPAAGGPVRRGSLTKRGGSIRAQNESVL
jgi:VanZ family protein